MSIDHTIMKIYLKLLLASLSLGISQAALAPGEPLVVGQTFLVGSLDPTKGSNPWALTSHGISEKLFTVDADGELVGQVGQSVTKISETVWDVTIKPDYKFSDGTAVNAEHIAACLNQQNQENSSAQSSLGSITATATDDLTVRIRSEKPTHIMMSVLAEWVFAIYYQNSDGNYVFTGPYKVEKFSETLIELSPNQYYVGAEERVDLKIEKYSSGDDLAQGVKDKKVDIGFHLPIHTLPELRQVEGIRIRSFEVGYHYMTFFNIDTLPDVRVRKAIDVAIDRTVLSQALAGGTATRSLFPDNSPFYSDDSDQHGDADAAEALLDEAGWTLSNGKRMKDGEELTIRLVAYPHRPGLVIMQPVIAEAIESLGIMVETILTGDDWSETATIISDRTFDMLMWAQHTLPAGDPAWFLNSFFHSGGGNNHANFASSTVDTLLETLSNAESHAERVFLTDAVQNGIHLEVPVSNLVTPMWHVSVSDNVKDYEPYGSDYYVIRADLRAEIMEEVSSGSFSATGRLISALGIMIGGLLFW